MRFDDVEKMIDEASLEESRAMNRMLADYLKNDREDRHKTRRIGIICATICVVAIVVLGGILGVLASGISIETTTETTSETITQDTGEGGGDNVFQAGEGAQYFAGGES